MVAAVEAMDAAAAAADVASPLVWASRAFSIAAPPDAEATWLLTEVELDEKLEGTLR